LLQSDINKCNIQLVLLEKNEVISKCLSGVLSSSTMIASRLPVASGYDVIGEDTIADAILD
jgi:hypothetical protein